MKWYEKENNHYNGVIISSRVRLARNIERFSFPNRITTEDARAVIKEVADSFFGGEVDLDTPFNQIDIEDVNQIDKIAMMERHLVSILFLGMKIPTSLIVSADESASVMINEEDHIRIQALETGMNLMDALKMANTIDDRIEKNIRYAFDRKIGYLTACPTNIGTGLRASYMVHVPALETTGQLRLLLDAVSKFGLTVRGMHGEGTEASGSVFQISNQMTLGSNEHEIIENLTSITKQIVEQELILRDKFLNEKRMEFEDGVYRSYGILTNARVLTSKEAMTLLSDVKLGFELGVLKTDGDHQINIFDLMTNIQAANLQRLVNKNLSVDERDIARAKYIRENLPKIS
jgi:protein arginine kinase